MIRVAVVDDCSIVVRALCRIVRCAGYEAIPCYSVAEVISVGLGLADVVVSDYDMPGGGGLAVLERATQLGVPVIFHTGRCDVKHEHVVLKPCSSEELLAAIRRAVIED